ncbi:MAG: hypothetical protein ACKV0T_27485 [Planctomycetales bacterium]
MNNTWIRSLTVVAGVTFAHAGVQAGVPASQVNAAAQTARATEQKTALFGLFGCGNGCRTGCGSGGYGYRGCVPCGGYGGGYARPVCNPCVPPCGTYGSCGSYCAPAPFYGAGACGAPGYGAPAYGAPAYSAPIFGAPSFGAPSGGFPGYGIAPCNGPGYSAPGYGQGGYPAPWYGSVDGLNRTRSTASQSTRSTSNEGRARYSAAPLRRLIDEEGGFIDR